MQESQLLEQLNQPQQQAVSSQANNLLVLAGAGSGKTRVLVHRIAWLIKVKHVSPHSILAVTFTNKAAKEMSHRIESLLNMPIRGMWVGTFHGLAHRLLRTHWQDLGLQENFQVLDSDDQKRLLKRIMKEMAIDEKELPVRDVQWFINNCKDDGQRVKDLEKVFDYRQKQLQAIYQNYEQLCNRSSLVDFAELLLRAHELWLHHPHILTHYQNRFQFIMVDEFQDTNTIQYAWIKVLSGANQYHDEYANNTHVMVVGDDDQSIYGWRGAKIEHIQKFEKDFYPAEVVRLEQNYRSSANILNAANAVIQNNTDRLGKTLWTEDNDGDPIYVYQAFNEYDEAEYIVDQIKQYQEKGSVHSELAVLYRSNAQSRVIEEYLLRSAIPYRVYGGLRFFDRLEIRDALAYLRLTNSRLDDAAFERIINLPSRGIGQRSIDKIRQYARENDLSLWFAAAKMIAEKQLTAKAANAIHSFMQMIDDFQQTQEDISLYELLEQIYETSGLKIYHNKDNNEKSRSRIENLDELINALKQYQESYDPLDYEAEARLLSEPQAESASAASRVNMLAEFLSHAVLESSEKQGEEWDDCVQLMTLHSAKGLEFNQVFLAGLEQGLFPHRMSSDDPNKLEEERRLCYVGITRAKKTLHISFADSRSMHGKTDYRSPSQFLKEIPAEYLLQVKASANKHNPFTSSIFSRAAQPTAKPDKNMAFKKMDEGDGLFVGNSVSHKKFGQGIILDIEGDGGKKRVQVRFASAGTRWLLASVAKLSC
ncbi:MAG: DNA helicase II [Pseudomonadota bacterium]